MAAVFGIAAASVVAVSAPAQAAPGDCAAGYTCLYTAYNYTNEATTSTLRFGRCIDSFTNYWLHNDRTSSAFNNGRTDTSYLYADAYQGGARLTLLRGAERPDLGAYNWNDRASSAYFSSHLGDKNTALCY